MDNNTKAQLIISRLRVGTDGNGVRTLVSFAGCPLDCRWCINPELKQESPDGKWYTPQELFDELERDHWYFVCTGGGITFSGGEPLTHSSFIAKFCSIASWYGKPWDIAVETSLHVAKEKLEEVLPYVSSFIVDIKDTNAGIYYKYTGGSLFKVMSNLDLIKSKILADASISVIVRIPRIPVFNTPNDVESSIKVIREIYGSLFSIDTFEYVPDKSHVPVPDGKKICSILKDLRGSLLKENGLRLKQKKCNHKGNCPGTCPICDAELDYINGQPIQNYRQTIMKMGKYVQDLGIEPRLSNINQMPPLMGFPAEPPEIRGLFKSIKDFWDF